MASFSSLLDSATFDFPQPNDVNDDHDYANDPYSDFEVSTEADVIARELNEESRAASPTVHIR